MGNEYTLQMMLQDLEELMGISLFASLLGELPSMLISLAVYVFTALAIYTLAKRRGINNPWLAWIPFANSWLMGCIADHYNAVAKHETKYRRRVLLWTEVATSAIAIVMLVLVVVMLFNLLAFGLDNLESVEAEMPAELLSSIAGPMIGIVLLCLVLAPVAIVGMVFSFIALHEIYKSCDPGNATLYLILSIFIGYAQPILLFLCRNKDLGMPAKAVPQPEYVPYEPVYSEPTPPVEPWEKNEE